MIDNILNNKTVLSKYNFEEYRNKMDPGTQPTDSEVCSIRLPISKINCYPTELYKILDCLQVLDANSKPIKCDHDVVAFINNRLRTIEKSTKFIQFDNSTVTQVLSNKNLFLVTNKIADNIIVHQFITNRNIEFYIVFDNEYFISFYSAQQQTIRSKKLSQNSVIEWDINCLDVINNQPLTIEIKNDLFAFRYINYKYIESCQTFKELFKILNELHKSTSDLNFIKSLCCLSKYLYNHLKSEGGV